MGAVCLWRRRPSPGYQPKSTAHCSPCRVVSGQPLAVVAGFFSSGLPVPVIESDARAARQF